MAKPKKIINKPEDSVEEFIEGLLLQYPNRLVKLANHNVLLTSTPPSDGSVQLLSGGGSGHEPSHAGWIGNGMLAGAICGGIFASPSVAQILAAIRASAATSTDSKTKGILLIVKNYTGDRLNFGLAIEKASQEGIPCQMVVVADDCALQRTKGITGARGVAGTVLVHKIAGAAAALGKSLEEVVDLATQATRRMGTMGVALGSVTTPGASTVNDRLADDKTIELGLGIHGEAGLKTSPLLTANEIAKELIETIKNYGRTEGDEDRIVPMFEKGDDVCVLVNNLGGTSNFEMSILARSAVKVLEDEYGCTVSRLLVGAYMTSFDMHGASISVLNLTGASKEFINLLDAPTDAPAWALCDMRKGDQPRPSATERPEVVVKETETPTVDLPKVDIKEFSATAKSLIQKAAQALSEQEEMLTKYDTIVGDGDCGYTMKRGATELLERLEKGTVSTEHPVPMFATMADSVSASMGGTSGVLLELMFRKMSSFLSRSSAIGASEMSQAFQAGVDAIKLYGGATVGSRTMLDAMIPSATALVQNNNLTDASNAAKAGADTTAKMGIANAGRSNYLSAETLQGTPDPGAVAVSIVMGALC